MTPPSNTFILTINCGSSSLKFGLYNAAGLQPECSGTVNSIGEDEGELEIRGKQNNLIEKHTGAYPDLAAAVKAVVHWLMHTTPRYQLKAIGHRIVQGGPDHREPERITGELLNALDQLVYLAPNHLPGEIAAVKALQAAFPDVPQVACFDTAFHRNLPDFVKFYPVPAIYQKKGLMKYGFHGLSYEYILQQLIAIDPAVLKQKVIIAHLGNGASMAAVQNGVSVDTTMGLSPVGGLVMGTRSGDLDPGVLLFLMKQYHLTPNQLDDVLSKESGLKAIGGAADVQELLKREQHDPKAALALTVCCYQAKKFIGSLAAAMGGTDLLVFTGGIGQHSAIIRERICADLGFIGIQIDKKSNDNNSHNISAANSRVKTIVMKTDEEAMIAQHTKKIIR